MATGMPLPAYLRLLADRIEAAEANHQDYPPRPAEALRLIEILRDELASQVTKRRVALADILKQTG